MLEDIESQQPVKMMLLLRFIMLRLIILTVWLFRIYIRIKPCPFSGGEVSGGHRLSDKVDMPKIAIRVMAVIGTGGLEKKSYRCTLYAYS